jgi:hypothetical protein
MANMSFTTIQGIIPGEPLAVITKDAIAVWKRDTERHKKEKQDKKDREEHERELLLEKQREAEAETERERQSGSLCDQMAANPTDPRKPTDVSGAPYDQLKTQVKAALEACMVAVRIYPDEQRYRYQYARALQVDEPEKALALHRDLVRDNYPASDDNLGWLLIETHKDFQQAIYYFKEGTQRGDADSMVSLAEMIDEQHLIANNPEAARYALFSRAAKLGHPGAQRFLEQERVKFQQLQQQREFQQQQQQLMLRMFGTMFNGIVHH